MGRASPTAGPESLPHAPVARVLSVFAPLLARVAHHGLMLAESKVVSLSEADGLWLVFWNTGSTPTQRRIS